MKRRAILIFADALGIDLARRRLPNSLRPLLTFPRGSELCLDADVHVFSSIGESSTVEVALHRQYGRTFGEKLENAVAQLESLGYEEVVAVGRDCPSLVAADLALAFQELQEHRLVLGPDHRGGCYLIALRLADRQLLRGIRWKQNTDCAELSARGGGPSQVFLLAVKHDLDSWADVRLFARSGERLGKLAAAIVASLSASGRDLACFVDLASQAVRVRGQMPPPAFAG